jgi:molybdenum cofactor cytidylyltransferase
MRQVGIIILAAGGSTRLGRPKQLLAFQGRSLIRRVTLTALASICRPVVVVLGAYAGSIKVELLDLPVTLVCNSEWEAGIGSSIKLGLKAMATMESATALQTEAALFMLGDQPFITPAFLNELAGAFSVSGGIVASAYHNTVGVPAVFGANFHGELVSLPRGQGAKCIMTRHPEKVHAIDFPEGVIDIDTQEDYELLLASQ